MWRRLLAVGGEDRVADMVEGLLSERRKARIGKRRWTRRRSSVDVEIMDSTVGSWDDVSKCLALRIRFPQIESEWTTYQTQDRCC